MTGSDDRKTRRNAEARAACVMVRGAVRGDKPLMVAAAEGNDALRLSMYLARLVAKFIEQDGKRTARHPESYVAEMLDAIDQGPHAG